MEALDQSDYYQSYGDPSTMPYRVTYCASIIDPAVIDEKMRIKINQRFLDDDCIKSLMS